MEGSLTRCYDSLLSHAGAERGTHRPPAPRPHPHPHPTPQASPTPPPPSDTETHTRVPDLYSQHLILQVEVEGAEGGHVLVPRQVLHVPLAVRLAAGPARCAAQGMAHVGAQLGVEGQIARTRLAHAGDGTTPQVVPDCRGWGRRAARRGQHGGKECIHCTDCCSGGRSGQPPPDGQLLHHGHVVAPPRKGQRGPLLRRCCTCSRERAARKRTLSPLDCIDAAGGAQHVDAVVFSKAWPDACRLRAETPTAAPAWCRAGQAAHGQLHLQSIRVVPHRRAQHLREARSEAHRDGRVHPQA